MKMNKDISEQLAIKNVLVFLDKGIDEVEAGKLHTVDDAFQIVRDKVENELQKNDI